MRPCGWVWHTKDNDGNVDSIRCVQHGSVVLQHEIDLSLSCVGRVAEMESALRKANATIERLNGMSKTKQIVSEKSVD